MIIALARNKREEKFIEKLNDIGGLYDYWDTIDRMMKNVKTEYNRERYRKLATIRYDELYALEPLSLCNTLYLEINDVAGNGVADVVDLVLKDRPFGCGFGGSRRDYMESLYGDLESYSKREHGKEDIRDICRGTSEYFDDLMDMSIEELSAKYDVCVDQLSSRLFCFFEYNGERVCKSKWITPKQYFRGEI